MRRTNQAGIDLIKSFEKLELRAYKDAVGILTIGYGHTGSDVRKGETITEAEAEELLRIDLNEAEAAVDDAVRATVTDNQFSAMVSLAFNIGGGAFGRSTLVRMLNQGDEQGAADQFLKWNKAGGKVLAGLTRRRKAERALFLTPDEPADEPTGELNGEAASEPAPPQPQQNVEAGGTGFVVNPTPSTPPPPEPIARPSDNPIQIATVEPAKSGAAKSIWATIVAAVAWIGLNIQEFFSKAYNAAQSNPMAVVLLVCGSLTILIIYWKYQDRQTRLDEQRQKQAHELMLEQMRLAADPNKYSVVVTPQEKK